MPLLQPLLTHLLARLHQVRANLGRESVPLDGGARFADAVDSMGLVEFLSLLADDCGVTVEAIEDAAGRRFGTVAELASALLAAGILPGKESSSPARSASDGCLPGNPSLLLRAGSTMSSAPVWLAATAVGAPARRQSAAAINALLRRPAGWLERRAGIHSRGVWGDDDALDIAARTARACLERAGVPVIPGALLVTSEAPPVLVGLAAGLHHRLELPLGVPALDVGGACTGFLSCLWIGQRLLVDAGAVLIVAVEAPSRWLPVEPGAAGETAALFGDGVAACLLTSRPIGADSLLLGEVVLQSDGGAGHLLQVRHEPGRGFVLGMNGVALAERAVRAMAEAVSRLADRHGLAVEQLSAVVAHGGNGRMPALLARQLGLPVECVWSETAHRGNLGSASLPAAWAAHAAEARGPVIWTAAGAGLHWGAALFHGPGPAKEGER